MSKTSDIVQKLWSLCHILRDDGITYHQYVTELTLLLFLKMAKETEKEARIPKDLRWDTLRTRTGTDAVDHYKRMLLDLAKAPDALVRGIYANASSSLRQPKHLHQLVLDIEDLEWFAVERDQLGAMYEDLLQRNANETKSGAGQYFTPRPLIDAIVACVKPKAGERIQDPAAGTGGFLIQADTHIKRETEDLFKLSVKDQEFQRREAFLGVELVPETRRLGLMNALLHDLEGPVGTEGAIRLGDTLTSFGAGLDKAHVILTNPPFGTKKGGGGATRDDFTFPTSNKQLAFLEHIYRGLDYGGRAAVVVPDNVLFEDGVGREIRADLMNKCDLHTVLRLPAGIFYAQGVKTNVLFFTRGAKGGEKGNTKSVWVYDLRANAPSFGKRTPFTREYLEPFVKAYGADPLGKSKRKDEGESGRWRKFTREEIAKRGDNLDIAWLKDDSAQDAGELGESAKGVDSLDSVWLKDDSAQDAGAPALPVGEEGQHWDRKSLRLVAGKQPNFSALGCDCVAFANAAGGRILIGIEDGSEAPPPDQRIDASLPERIRKRIGELTVNVHVLAAVRRVRNGGEYIDLTIPPARAGVASMSDGRYLLRVGDQTRPVVGDEVLRLIEDRPSHAWEQMVSTTSVSAGFDPETRSEFLVRVRASRVNTSVKEKSDNEILTHYGLTRGGRMTNLGILMLGNPLERKALGSAPVIQAIKFDETGTKVHKEVWDDYELSPLELVEAVWKQIPDFHETYELPEGLFRKTIPAFDDAVIRELLVNALVHRPYTQRGDIFLNLHADRLEVVNPGRLPPGVTPRNILRASQRRNDGLAKVFYDLGMMEREGSGFDLIYDRLLSTGRGAPSVREDVASVHVTVPRRVVRPEIIRILAEAERRHALNQRERIVLGLLAQSDGMTAIELMARLDLLDPDELRTWIEQPLALGLLGRTGQTRATRYFVPPALMSAAGLDVRTNLARVQPHRLRALILEDLERFPGSSSSEIHGRIGLEIHAKAVKRAIDDLVADRKVVASGKRRWTRYSVAMPSLSDNVREK